MGFIADIFTSILNIIVAIIEIQTWIVEQIMDFILEILGFGPQTLEYYHVQNIPLFEDPDTNNPIALSVLNSVITGRDITSELLYGITFRSGKKSIRDFMKFIEDGNYFTGFPSIESMILVIDNVEVDAVLTTLEGAPCTIETSTIRTLDNAFWVKYWLQENKVYDVGANELDEGTPATATTSPGTPAATGVTTTPSTNHFNIDITDEVVTSDSMAVNGIWEVDFGNIIYNSGPDTYTITVFNANITKQLSYTAPTKPLQLHYIVTYYIDYDPTRVYLFIYKAGSGTYPTLDTIESPIDIVGSTIQALPAIPLRISNSNYTTFGATKAAQIEDICEILELDAEAILDGVLTDSGLAPGDVDNVYINFGVRMWDTSQTGMKYLFNMCENIFPSQGSTQGDYDGTISGTPKPQNNIIIKTDDYEYIFQFSYIAFEFTTLAAIDADTSSPENGIYYSDLSKFDGAGLLRYSYYNSSGKGTYNAGFKASNLAEVAAFLAGSGVVNPGTPTTEAANWMQPTTRMRYPLTLEESNGSVSSEVFIVPDLVYENVGGNLRIVSIASEATTSGQSITYYFCTPTGLHAYTIKAPIASLKVVDGDSGRFNLVKFNLASQYDLMVPFIHTFIKDLPVHIVTQLFLAGTHTSIYVAHYEVIELPLWAKLLIIAVIVIVAIVIILFPPSVPVALKAVWALLLYGSLYYALLVLVEYLIVIFIIYAIAEVALRIIAEFSPEAAIILQVLFTIGWIYYSGPPGGFSGLDVAGIFTAVLDGFSRVLQLRAVREEDDLNLFRDELSGDTRLDDLQRLYRDIFNHNDSNTFTGLSSDRRATLNPIFPEHMFMLYDARIEGQSVIYDIESAMTAQVSGGGRFI